MQYNSLICESELKKQQQNKVTHLHIFYQILVKTRAKKKYIDFKAQDKVKFRFSKMATKFGETFNLNLTFTKFISKQNP